MEVTSIRIKKTHNLIETKAIVSIVLNNAICIQNIRVIEKNNKIRIAMPQRRDKKGFLRDIVFPINEETREIIVNSILNKYCEMEDKDIC